MSNSVSIWIYLILLIPLCGYPQGSVNSYQRLSPIRGVGGQTCNAGYPIGGPVEPNVIAEWGFNQGSGDIIDTVASITVTKVGTPSYGTACTGQYSIVSPGITFGVGNYFKTAGDDANLNLGTNDATLELMGHTASTSDQLIFDCTAAGAAGYWFDIETNGGSFKFVQHLEADDLTTVNVAIAGATAFADGADHKIRWIDVRSGNAEVRLDGVSQGSASLAGVSGKSILCHGKGVGVWNATNAINFLGTMCNLRLSGNSTNNSGCGNGG